MVFNVGGPELLILGSPLILLLMLLPGFVAVRGHKRHATGVFFVTLLLGWTGIGWLGALVWALLSPRTRAQRPRGSVPPGVACPECGRWGGKHKRACSQHPDHTGAGQPAQPA